MFPLSSAERLLDYILGSAGDPEETVSLESLTDQLAKDLDKDIRTNCKAMVKERMVQILQQLTSEGTGTICSRCGGSPSPTSSRGNEEKVEVWTESVPSLGSNGRLTKGRSSSVRAVERENKPTHSPTRSRVCIRLC